MNVLVSLLDQSLQLFLKFFQTGGLNVVRTWQATTINRHVCKSSTLEYRRTEAKSFIYTKQFVETPYLATVTKLPLIQSSTPTWNFSFLHDNCQCGNSSYHEKRDEQW